MIFVWFFHVKLLSHYVVEVGGFITLRVLLYVNAVLDDG